MCEAGSDQRDICDWGRSKRGNDERVNQHGAVEIRLSDVRDGVLVVLAAVTRGIEDSVDRERMVEDGSSVGHRQLGSADIRYLGLDRESAVAAVNTRGGVRV